MIIIDHVGYEAVRLSPVIKEVGVGEGGVLLVTPTASTTGLITGL